LKLLQFFQFSKKVFC